ncbi:MAG TPA: D-alanyl-D-alanine carboxypeptidase family protein [Candidatus Binataceae bacterium]|nr:D-alanyl-D-alanine carboxypeptidase family protein [Candidatus Binataceae bacterium]
MEQVVESNGWNKIFPAAAAAIGVLALVAFSASSARASVRHHHHTHTLRKRSRTAVQPYKGALLEDADSGKILYAQNDDMEWPPASMAKMMLLLVTEDQLKAGHVHLDDPVRISERSAHTMGSRLGLVEGQVYPLRELMKAALIKSANDAAVAIAEKVGGSVEATVRMMNARARGLGMDHTEYRTVDGLPPRPAHDVDHTSARDLATVARQLILTTNLLRWSSLEQTEFDGGVCMLHTTNHLIGHFEGCDGLKTGFTFQAGFNVTATAKRGNLRLIAVVLGAPSNQQRFAQAAKLLEWGFDHYTAVSLLKSGQALPVQVQLDSGKYIQPIAAHDLTVVLPKGDIGSLKVSYQVPSSVTGPVTTGETLGRVVARDRGEEISEIAAISPVAAGVPESAGANDGWNPPPLSTYNQADRVQEPQPQ